MTITRYSLLLAALLVTRPALAQNAFRPLPELPELRNALGGGGVEPAARPRTLFDELEQEAELPRERTRPERLARYRSLKGCSSPGTRPLSPLRS